MGLESWIAVVALQAAGVAEAEEVMWAEAAEAAEGA